MLLPADLRRWAASLPQDEQLQVFQRLSGYLSNREIRTVMAEAARGKTLHQIHVQMGFFEKYYVDFLRIRRILYPDMQE